jgi:hypothetical protein
MKNFFKTFCIVLGLALLLGGFIWYVILEIMRWDVPMTKLGHMVYVWKPTVIALIGAFIAKISSEWN